MLSAILGLLFVVAGGIFAVNAIGAEAGAETIMHQLYAALQWMTASVLIVGGSILCRLGFMGPKPVVINGDDAMESKVLRAKATITAESLETIAADIAWFKELKSKELLRAKAAEQARKQQGK